MQVSEYGVGFEIAHQFVNAFLLEPRVKDDQGNFIPSPKVDELLRNVTKIRVETSEMGGLERVETFGSYDRWYQERLKDEFCRSAREIELYQLAFFANTEQHKRGQVSLTVKTGENIKGNSSQGEEDILYGVQYNVSIKFAKDSRSQMFISKLFMAILKSKPINTSEITEKELPFYD